MGGRGQYGFNGWYRELKRKATKTLTEVKVGKKTAKIDKGELVYGSYDTGVSDSVRESESKMRDLEYETAIVYDKDGNVVQQKDGGSSSVSGLEVPEGGTITHNHPWVYSSDSDGVELGGTLSAGDIAKFRRYGTLGLKTIRATTFEGTYSLTKTDKYNADVMVEVEHRVKAITDALNQRTEDLDALKFNFTEARKSGVSLSEWAKRIAKERDREVNNAVVEINNLLYRYQRRGGYTYTLEPRYRKKSGNATK